MKVIGTSRNSNKQIKELCGEGLERHRSREAHSHSNQSHKTTSGQQMIPRAAADMGNKMGRCGEAESNKTLNKQQVKQKKITGDKRQAELQTNNQKLCGKANKNLADD